MTAKKKTSKRLATIAGRILETIMPAEIIGHDKSGYAVFLKGTDIYDLADFVLSQTEPEKKAKKRSAKK